MRTTISHVVFWVTATLVVLTMLFLGVQSARAGELYTVTTVRSYHVDRQAGYNEKNYGVGLEYPFNKTWAVSAGEYKNSFSRKSNYFGAVYTPFVEGNFKAGLSLFNVSGYDTDNLRRFQPIAIPTLVYEGKGWGINTVLVPREPTKAMCQAGQDACSYAEHDAGMVYRAMLAAAEAKETR